MMFRVALLSLLVACGEKDDDTSTGPTSEPPDVVGRYNMMIAGTSGCEGEETYITNWASGPIEIEGTPDALSFDFGDGIVLSGAVDGTYSYYFSGPGETGTATLAIQNSGRFYVDPDYEECDRWIMDGEFEVEVDDDEFTTNNCTITGLATATEIVVCE